MTKAPTPAEMSKGQSDNRNNATKKFDFTAVADRLRTVSWSSYGHPTGVVNLVYGPNLPTPREQPCNQKDTQKSKTNSHRTIQREKCKQTSLKRPWINSILTLRSHKFQCTNSERNKCAPPISKRAQVQGLKDSRFTIRWHDDRILLPLGMFGQVPSLKTPM